MMRIDIDFQSSGRNATTGTIAVLLVAALTCAAAGWEYISMSTSYKNAEAVLSAAQRKVNRDMSMPRIPESQIIAINSAIQKLNFPWPELFSMFERNQSRTVVLLALEPDVATKTLKIQAEAKTPEDMVDFVDTLEGGDIFTSVSLIRHEINEPDPNKPYRFTMEAQWAEDH